MRIAAMRVALAALALAALAAVPARAAVPPYDATKIYPTEAAFTSSIKVYQDALAANPRDADAAYWLGDAYWEASVLYRNGTIGYGAGYLDKAIASLERAVSLDDKNLGAWSVLAEAYLTRGTPPNNLARQPTPGDDDKAEAAERKVLALSLDPAAANRGLPARRGVHSAEVPITYLSLPDRSVRFRPGDYIVVGDPDTRLLYRYPCAALPAIRRPMMFLTKWEAINRGYAPATVCAPP